jgi:hypothetical protein
MPYYLRDVKEGQRFVLVRSGDIYTKLAIVEKLGHDCHMVMQKGATKAGSLSHSCVVRPIFKLSEIKKEAVAFKKREVLQKKLRDLKEACKAEEL